MKLLLRYFIITAPSLYYYHDQSIISIYYPYDYATYKDIKKNITEGVI